jgi:glycosyltransferase involved in cell wall biosynthesis
MNVKMLEYMAWGLQMVTTTVGIRGVAMAGGGYALICGIEPLCRTSEAPAGGPELRRRLSGSGRALVEEAYGAEKTGGRHLALVESLVEKRGSSLPPAAKGETAA